MYETLAALLKRLRLTMAADAPAAKAGISGALAAALDEIAARPGIGVAAVAEALAISVASASVLVTKLTRQGFVQKQESNEDGRAVALFVTEKGKIMAYRILQYRLAFAKRMLKGLDMKEKSEFIRILQKALDTSEVI
jgi:DNA-binding MarR family transcriptional regulator